MLHRLHGQELILFLAVSSVSVYVSRNRNDGFVCTWICDSVINILCYVDVAYSYTLPATGIPLKLFLTSTYEMKLIYDRTHLK